MTDNPLLSIQDLKIRFQSEEREFFAVNGITLNINRGEIVGLAGESGSGKSMMALAVTNLITPPGMISEGKIIFDGQDVAKLERSDLLKLRGGRVGMIFQDPMTSLNPVFTVGDQISDVYRFHKGVTKAKARSRAIDFMNRMGIKDASLRYDSYPHQLSGGMRQRVLIAMALICEPDLLIADEPTTALDATVQAQVLDLLLEMRELLGLSILFISHDLTVVSELADRIAIIYAGKLVETLPAATLTTSARHPYTTGLLETLPTIEKRGQPLPVLAGILTETDRINSGCPFARRCPIVLPPCALEMPEFTSVSQHHETACHAIEVL